MTDILAYVIIAAAFAANQGVWAYLWWSNRRRLRQGPETNRCGSGSVNTNYPASAFASDVQHAKAAADDATIELAPLSPDKAPEGFIED